MREEDEEWEELNNTLDSGAVDTVGPNNREGTSFVGDGGPRKGVCFTEQGM